MPAVAQPKTLLAGESRTFRVTVELESNGTRVDLTTATAIEFQVKTGIGVGDAPSIPISLSVGSGITLLAQTGATLGQADIELSPSHTATLNGTFYYDVVVVLTGGKRYYVVPPSKFVVNQVVNQP